MSTRQSSSEQLVMNALSSASETTAAELASATGLGRSTVGNALVKLERSRKAQRVAGGRQGAVRLPDRWRQAGKRKSSPESAKSVQRPRGPKAGRLRPGQLDELVMAYVNERAGARLGPTAVAKGLGRSSGAVANCLARLAKAGHVREVGKRPRRYRVVRNSRRR
jgi:DNA-binding MarR family transcriptional regulator